MKRTIEVQAFTFGVDNKPTCCSNTRTKETCVFLQSRKFGSTMVCALLAVVISGILIGVYVYFKVHPIFLITDLFTVIPSVVLVKYFIFSKDKS